ACCTVIDGIVEAGIGQPPDRISENARLRQPQKCGQCQKIVPPLQQGRDRTTLRAARTLPDACRFAAFCRHRFRSGANGCHYRLGSFLADVRPRPSATILSVVSRKRVTLAPSARRLVKRSVSSRLTSSYQLVSLSIRPYMSFMRSCA